MWRLRDDRVFSRIPSQYYNLTNSINHQQKSSKQTIGHSYAKWVYIMKIFSVILLATMTASTSARRSAPPGADVNLEKMGKYILSCPRSIVYKLCSVYQWFHSHFWCSSHLQRHPPGTLGWGYPYGWGLQSVPVKESDKKRVDDVKEVRRGTFGMHLSSGVTVDDKKKKQKEQPPSTHNNEHGAFFLAGLKSTQEIEDMMDADLLE